MISDDFFFSVSNPQVFTGVEINAVRRPVGKEEIGICLVFPDTYEIGMSHAGLKILYHMLNRIPGVYAERAFLPSPEALPWFREHHVPLFSLERRQPLGQFAMIGVSLLSELNFTNIPLLLDLAGIPILQKERGEEIPLVGAGGISISNPEPLRDFFDFFAFGDGEELFPDILERFRSARLKRWNRERLLQALAGIEGVYVPSQVPLRISAPFYFPEMAGKKIEKRVLRNFRSYPTTAEEIVPIGNTVFNRMNVEIARGCPNACRFCQAKQFYAPFRVRPAQTILNSISAGLAGTGYESFSLASLSSGDHPQLNDILPLIPSLLGPDIAFSVPSLRPGSLRDNLLKTIGLFRRTGITIVPEAGSQRLRDILKKDVSEEEIMRAVSLALQNGWQKLKLYFMIGLPGETDEDIDAIPSLILRILEMCRRERKRLHIHASFSPFVPKPHTPFQWAGMKSLSYLEAAISRIRAPLSRFRQIELDFHDPRKALVETILARGDSRVGELILEAYRRGEVFTAWNDSFHFSVWEPLIESSDAERFIGEILPGTPLPWDFLCLGTSPEMLRREYDRAVQAQPISGSAGHETAGSDSDDGHADPIPEAYSTKGTAVMAPVPVDFAKIRIFYTKKGDFRFFSQLSVMQYLERLLRLSGLRFRTTEGFHRRIRMSFLPPLPVAAESRAEVVEVHVETGLTEMQILERLQRTSPIFEFTAVRFSGSPASLGKELLALTYTFGLDRDEVLPDDFPSFLGENDRWERNGDELLLRIEFAGNGQERFARLYRRLDPDKKRLRSLTRTAIEFKHDV